MEGEGAAEVKCQDFYYHALFLSKQSDLVCVCTAGILNNNNILSLTHCTLGVDVCDCALCPPLGFKLAIDSFPITHTLTHSISRWTHCGLHSLPAKASAMPGISLKCVATH